MKLSNAPFRWISVVLLLAVPRRWGGRRLHFGGSGVRLLRVPVPVPTAPPNRSRSPKPELTTTRRPAGLGDRDRDRPVSGRGDPRLPRGRPRRPGRGQWFAKTAGWDARNVLIMDELGRPSRTRPAGRSTTCCRPVPTSTGRSSGGWPPGSGRTTWSSSSSRARRSRCRLGRRRRRAATGRPFLLPDRRASPAAGNGRAGCSTRRSTRWRRRAGTRSSAGSTRRCTAGDVGSSRASRRSGPSATPAPPEPGPMAGRDRLGGRRGPARRRGGDRRRAQPLRRGAARGARHPRAAAQPAGLPRPR